MAASDPYIQSLVRRHHLHPGTGSSADDLEDLAVRALMAELRHISVRANVLTAWTVENRSRTRTRRPRGRCASSVDAYIRSLLDRHRLSARPGESGKALTRRALRAEINDLNQRTRAVGAANRRLRRRRRRVHRAAKSHH